MDPDGVVTTTSGRGYVMDFGDVFLQTPADATPTAGDDLHGSSAPATAMTAAPTDAVRWGDTKPWQLPEYNSLEDNAVYLNRQIELQHVGVRALPVRALRFATSSSEDEVRRTMDCIHWLLQSRREEVLRNDELTEQFARLEKDVARKASQLQIANIHLETERKRNADLENLLAARDAAMAREKLALQADKRALEKKCIQLQHVDSNYKAQLRKSEVQYERLQKQYTQHLNKASSEKRGMALGKELNGRAESLRLRKDAQKRAQGEHAIVNKMLKSYEQQHTTLVTENDTLRRQLVKFHSELKQLTTEFKATTRWLSNQQGMPQDVETQLQLGDESIATNLFTMPILASGNNVLAMIEDRLESLRTKIGCLMELKHEKHVATLEAQLRDAVRIIQEQDHLIHLALDDASPKMSSGEPRLELSQLEDMMESLSHEKQALAITAENMESERHLFTQQAEKLDHDRLAFEMFRQEVFLDETDDRVRPDSKKRHRPSSSNVPPSPVSLLGLPLPPTPETTRVLREIGFDKHGQPMSPIASPVGAPTSMMMEDTDMGPLDDHSL
ncbi:hypothetical protein SDRG_11254 [Saprolegnia diclina VS20]|uniref:Uncharacterized protein n=1 Tax=Saprolegnia diclina (strain VS20) TaxID=1156394 RepID=T0RFK6_SAPDV|nr:hypothetical protein SDRG_11254 [Saprolegnia diclina VS20]EQC31068.1 hypothetical protein SDRG_11254 [Saprolegnia diclina VS20]|eukprot:XP_008615507.1 hypothetical protein SDRG_11254 [Saprolegnia diclina VS20]